MPTLLLVDTDAGGLTSHTAKAVTAAVQLGAEVHALVTGPGAADIAADVARIEGITRVLAATGPALADGLAEPVAALIVSLAATYDAIVGAATSTGKSILPRVAALLDVMQISEVIGIEAPDIFKRPIYAGNAVLTVQATDPVKVMTIRTSAFAAAGSGDTAVVEVLEWTSDNPVSRFISASAPTTDRPDLSAASIVVSGGRAFGSREDFDRLLLPLAAKLGAAVGASRAAVDAGYAANDMQVGQTGRIVAPQLYIACGISGAIQHLAGMKDSQVIVAINKDADAPIFKLADYGLVGDLFVLLPELTDAL